MTYPFTDETIAEAKDAAVATWRALPAGPEAVRSAVSAAASVLGASVSKTVEDAQAAASTAMGAARRAVASAGRPDQLALARQWFASNATPGRYDEALLTELTAILADDIDERALSVADSDSPIEARYDALVDKFILEADFSVAAAEALRRIVDSGSHEEATGIARSALGH